MPVTVVLPHEPLPLSGLAFATNEVDFLRSACPNDVPANITVFEGTFKGLQESDLLMPTGDGFFRGAIEAWAKHMHLVIRPEDVWFAILVQLSFYMVGHAEEVRHVFVSHQGKKKIFVERRSFDEIMEAFGHAIQENVKTPWLRDWIMPDFTTTTPSDILTASVLMMGLMEKYFEYGMGIICGIPSITLLGEQSDWENLLARLDRLSEFGKEPSEFASDLSPILRNFVETFKDPKSAAVESFWNGIVHAEPDYLCGAPPVRLSGWIMKFCRWDSTGARQHASFDELPVSYVKVPVWFKNTDQNLLLVAGSLGKRISPGAPDGYVEELRRRGSAQQLSTNSTQNQSTLQPMAGWMLYGDKHGKKDMVLPTSEPGYHSAGDAEAGMLQTAILANLSAAVGTYNGGNSMDELQGLFD